LDIIHCGNKTRARVYRLPSSKPVYEYQHLFHATRCKICEKELMQWRGEYPDGRYTQLIDVPQSEIEHWKRRIQAGEAKPEAQLMSEWAERVSRPADIAASYQLKLTKAHRWYKGQRV
jgi:hypothetical protein